MAAIPSTPSSSRNRLNDLTAASRSRIVRQRGSTIQFASFDPDTASGDPTNASSFRKLTLNEELCRPKRVVIETTPNGRSTWRFVPNARREERVENEGIWPRVVDVHGELHMMTQDQWDIFKLDRDYNCLVRLPPNHTTIRRSEKAPPIIFPSKPEVSEETPLKRQAAGYKRRLSESILSRRLSGSNNEGRRTKARPREDDSSSSSSSEDEAEAEGGDVDEEKEVNGMVIDDDAAPKRHQMSDRLKKVRANKDEARRKRWEWNAQRRQKEGPNEEKEEDENMMSWTEIPQSSPMPTRVNSSPFVKRKVDTFSDEGEAQQDESDSSRPQFKTYERAGSKRTRTVSPTVTRRAAEVLRQKRGNNRKEELDRRAKARQQAIHENIMRELYEEAARSHLSSSQSSEADGTFTPSAFSAQPTEQPSTLSSQPTEQPRAFSSQSTEQSSQVPFVDEEARRQAALEESKRKIAELEKDKHLWEEEARKRAAREVEERAHAEARRKARAASQQPSAAEQEKEKENTRQRAAEAEQGARETAAADLRIKRIRVREAAQRDAESWVARGWTPRRALERYTALSDAFDAMNFSKGDIVVFENVPWPILTRPGSFSVEDIDWSTVETFFRQVRVFMPSTEFKKLVEKSHRRFHPDRWRSRRVLHCVEDDEEKECLEVAANTVAQALTPLWQEVTGR